MGLACNVWVSQITLNHDMGVKGNNATNHKTLLPSFHLGTHPEVECFSLRTNRSRDTAEQKKRKGSRWCVIQGNNAVNVFCNIEAGLLSARECIRAKSWNGQGCDLQLALSLFQRGGASLSSSEPVGRHSLLEYHTSKSLWWRWTKCPY